MEKESYNSQYYYSWIRTIPKTDEVFARLVKRIVNEKKSGRYNRDNVLRSVSVSISNAFNDLKDPNFVSTHFPKVKREVATMFLSDIEHEAKWHLGEFKPLPIGELLSNKKFDTYDEMKVWTDRLSHTQFVSNIVKCRKTDWKYPNHYECNQHSIIPYGSKEIIDKFKTQYADQLKLGSHLRNHFWFMDHKKSVCFFEPNVINPNTVFGLCIQPRERKSDVIIPPRAEILSFARSFNCEHIDDHFKYDAKAKFSCFSILERNSIPTDERYPKITTVERIRYSNDRDIKYRDEDEALFHFDESEYQRDMKSLITDHEIGDVEVRIAERNDSLLHRTGTDTNKFEFWEYPGED